MATTFAGFAPSNIAEYFGVSPVAANGIIALGNGATIAALPADQQAALRALPPARFKPGASAPNQGFGDIPWGLDHLAQHPLGSHYHGDFNVVDLVASIATVGWYQVGKSALNIVEGGKVLPNVKTAFASQGQVGAVLQPTLGTNKALLVEGAIASGAGVSALTAAYPEVGTLLAAGGGVGASLLNKAKSAITNLVTGNDTGAPVSDSRGVSPGSPIYPSTGSPTYFVTGASSPGGATYITDGTSAPTSVAPSSPNAIAFSPALLPIVVLGSLALFFLLRSRRH